MEWKKSPDINSHIYSQLAFDSGNKHMQQGNYNLFNKLYWGMWTNTCRKMKLDHLLTPQARINSTWIKDCNVRPDTKKQIIKP